MTEEIIFEQAEDISEVNETISIIENQIMVINEVVAMPSDIYNLMDEHRIKVVVNAFKLIHKMQQKLLK
jgi:hypothetical protein